MLSVIIIALNEEVNIRRCLDSVRFADEIIVLDSGSADKTVAIAKEYTPNVFTTDWQGYGVQKERALSKATGDWVLNLDADESVPQELQREIKQAMQQKTLDAYRVPIQMNFYGQALKYSGSPSRHVRLFKRKDAHFSTDIVHEKIILANGSRIGKLEHSIQHHSFKDIRHALYKINKYSSYSAKIRIESNKIQSFPVTLLSTGWMFFRCFMLQRGFLDGRAGFLFAVFSAQGTFYRGMKQLYQDSNIEKIPDSVKAKED